jgi:RNA polymerase sigma-70 factor (ECF subfamily)
MAIPTANSLVTALATSQPGSYAALYDRMGRSMLRVATVMLRGSAEAEDAVQDVFVEIARQPDRLKHVLNLDAYVFAMLRNNVTRRLRARQSELRHLKQLAQPSGADEPRSASLDLDEALKALPDDQREVIALKVDGGLTFAEVAEILNVSPNTAASRYRYALEKLRRSLES